MGIDRFTPGRVQGTRKFGYAESIGTTAQTIWEHGGLYPYQSSGSVLQYKSGSTQDSPAGTGAGWLTTIGVDSAYNVVTETVTLNGTNVVTGTAMFVHPYRSYVESCGSTGTNVGVISASSRTIINSGVGQTQMCTYTVPTGKVGYLYALAVSETGGTNDYFIGDLTVQEFGKGWRNRDRFYVSPHKDLQRDFSDDPIKLPEKSRVEIRGRASANTVSVAADFVIREKDA